MKISIVLMNLMPKFYYNQMNNNKSQQTTMQGNQTTMQCNLSNLIIMYNNSNSNNLMNYVRCMEKRKMLFV